jgi:FtsP/CotA-like multicopper oxidase with cupredoxin domain
MPRLLDTALIRILVVSFALAGPRLSASSLPEIEINQNHRPAGVLHDGVLTIQMEIGKGEWHPEADGGIALAVYAFGESGHSLQNPGPLIRVPQNTEASVSLHNQLGVLVRVHGLNERSSDAVVQIAPGKTEHVRFKATTPGLYFYWGAIDTDDVRLRYGIDSELTGAFVVDAPGAVSNDEIFVMEMMSERPGASARQTLATINGKSWPYTQRFQYEVGQEARWRWINATNEPHALHLHGFYYRVDAFNRAGQITAYANDQRPTVVTQRIAQGETFDMSWSPTRAGQWLFHCHMFQHMIPAVVPQVPGLEVIHGSAQEDEHQLHEVHGMGQMVLGITVPEGPRSGAAAPWHARRKINMEISERDVAPRFAVTIHEEGDPEPAAKSPGLIGQPLILIRDEPVEIEVKNHLKDPTAIHWHGIEVESYYDGVPGWSGMGNQIAPPIEPGKSFTARITPPRAGTFIYHTHWHDMSQLTNGIYGPLIVLAPGEKYDPESDMTFVFSIGDFGALREIALINGTPQSKTLQLQAGKKYRLRFINISTNNQGMQVSLRNANGPVEWLNIAKDGVDLPPRMSKAQITITVGETHDVEFSSPIAQDLLLDLLLPAQKIHTTQTLAFVMPTPIHQ